MTTLISNHTVKDPEEARLTIKLSSSLAVKILLPGSLFITVPDLAISGKFDLRLLVTVFDRDESS